MNVLLSGQVLKRYACVMIAAELMSPLYQDGKEWGL